MNARYLSRDAFVPASVAIGAVKSPGIPKIQILILWKYTSSQGNSAISPNWTGRTFFFDISASNFSSYAHVPASVEIGAVKAPGI